VVCDRRHSDITESSSSVAVTDGLTEAANENEEKYGLERVKQQVTKHSGESLKVLCEMLLAPLGGTSTCPISAFIRT
jgi:serine phosphatase RsbU (regulator of sigma subunit)